uniref:Uncharacterized protein n=1 Tax=Coptotermes formosanus TaxID=36987 RepID=R4V0K6_COPFO|nr:hypothetical protein [Coptotermes formosanus]
MVEFGIGCVLQIITIILGAFALFCAIYWLITEWDVATFIKNLFLGFCAIILILVEVYPLSFLSHFKYITLLWGKGCHLLLLGTFTYDGKFDPFTFRNGVWLGFYILGVVFIILNFVCGDSALAPPLLGGSAEQ